VGGNQLPQLPQGRGNKDHERVLGTPSVRSNKTFQKDPKGKKNWELNFHKKTGVTKRGGRSETKTSVGIVKLTQGRR